MLKKAREIFIYILAIFGFYKLINYTKNKFFVPVYYDAFFSSNRRALCIIAPYYSIQGFRYSYCKILSNSKEVSLSAEIIDDPNRDCLIVLFKLPDSITGDFSYRIFGQNNRFFVGNNVIQGDKKAKSKLAMSTLFKYEVSFLKEWIDFHIKMGVEHFYLYENNKNYNEKIKIILSPYIEKGLVTHILWPYPYKFYNYRLKNIWPNDAHSFTQLPQINHCIYKYSSETEWLLYGDIDEYFFSPKNEKIIDVIQNINDVSGVSTINITGKWFGGNLSDISHLNEYGVVRSFVRSEKTPTSKNKCLFRTSDVHVASVHNSVVQSRHDFDIPYDILHFNHYRALGWKGRINPEFAREIEDKSILSIFS